MQGVTTFLWFDDQAEEAAEFYVGLFKDMGREDSAVTSVARYGAAGAEASGQPEGSVMSVSFRLDGQEFGSVNGGPIFPFTEAVSLVVNCATQEEIDGFWERLTDGGEEGPCGWCKDRYGLSWQVVPYEMEQALRKDPEVADRVMAEVLKMKKLDLATLERAARG